MEICGVGQSEDSDITHDKSDADAKMGVEPNLASDADALWK